MPKELKTSVKLDARKALDTLDKLERKINRINAAVNKTNSRNSGLSRAINDANKSANNLTKNVNKVNTANKQAAKSANQIANGYKKSSQQASILTKNLRTLISTYVGLMGAQAVLNTSDKITSAKNKLNYLNGGNTADTQLTMDKTYAAAQRSRGNYTDMIGNVSKSMTLASGAFQDNVDNAIRFQEIMSKAYTVGGASSAEQSSSMYQLIQALGSGILQGDELRSVREGAPIAYKEIEKFAQGVYNTTDSLKDMASEGKITSDIVVAAVMGMGESIDKAFADTDMTFAQAWDNIKNMATKAFEPVLSMLNEALNSSIGQSMLQGIGQVFVIIANGVLWVMNLLGTFFTWCADNWNWLKYIVIGILTALAVYLVWYTGVAIANAVVRIGLWIAEHWQMVLIILTLAAMVAAIVWWANTAASGCEFVCGALMMVGLAIMLIGVIVGSTALVIVGIIIALAGIIIYFLDYVMGAIYAAGAVSYNIGVGVLNGIIQAVYSIFVDPMMGIIEWFVNAFSGGFNGILGAAANAIGQLVSIVLGGLKIITRAIDAVGGTNLTGKISGWQASVKSWGKTETAVTHSVEAPSIKRKSVGDAWDAGFSKGTEWKNAIGAFGDNIKNKVSGLGDNFGLGKSKFGTFGADSGSYLPNATDPAYGVGGGYDPSKALKGIKGDTGSIADSMELADEDLEYLRKLAEMEWKKEFTTATIQVDMSNYNTINGTDDLDGIATRLADKLYEEMDAVANGVYA